MPKTAKGHFQPFCPGDSPLWAGRKTNSLDSPPSLQIRSPCAAHCGHSHLALHIRIKQNFTFDFAESPALEKWWEWEVTYMVYEIKVTSYIAGV